MESAEPRVYREMLRRCHGRTDRFLRIREMASRFLLGSLEISLAGVIYRFSG
jgi:hypothetical protein